MTDTTQEVTPQPQAGEGQPEPEQPNSEQLTPEQLRAQVKAANSEAAATRKRLRELEAKLTDAEKAKAVEAEKLAAEQGRFQELYETEKQTRAEMEAKLRQIEHDQLRRDAAQAAGIPLLWQRLQGDTAEELTEDAKTLATSLPRPIAPGLDGRAGQGGKAVAAIADEEVADFAARMGLRPEHVDRTRLAQAKTR